MSGLPPVDADYLCAQVRGGHHGACQHAIFISYRWCDQAVATAIRAHLEETYGCDVFQDIHCLPAGQEWKLGFCNVLRSPSVALVILVLSRRAMSRFAQAHTQEDNVLHEIELTLRRLHFGEINFVPLLFGEATTAPILTEARAQNLSRNNMFHADWSYCEPGGIAGVCVYMYCAFVRVCCLYCAYFDECADMRMRAIALCCLRNYR